MVPVTLLMHSRCKCKNLKRKTVFDSHTLYFLGEPKQLQGVRALVYIGESEASEPPVLDFMSFPFNVFIKVITHRTLYKIHVIVVANLTRCPRAINWVMLTFGVIKINPLAREILVFMRTPPS